MLISTSQFFWVFFFFLCLEDIPLSPQFAYLLFLFPVGWLHFLTLEKWPLSPWRCPMVPAMHSLWSPELYTIGVPHIWAPWVLLLWWADYCGQSGNCGWPWSSWLPGPALYRGCWPLVGGPESQGCWLRGLEGSKS